MELEATHYLDSHAVNLWGRAGGHISLPLVRDVLIDSWGEDIALGEMMSHFPLF